MAARASNSYSSWSSPRPANEQRRPRCCSDCCCSSPAATTRSDSGHRSCCHPRSLWLLLHQQLSAQHSQHLLTIWPTVVDSDGGDNGAGDEIVRFLERRPRCQTLPWHVAAGDGGSGGDDDDVPRSSIVSSPNCPRTTRMSLLSFRSPSDTAADWSWPGLDDEPPPHRNLVRVCW